MKKLLFLLLICLVSWSVQGQIEYPGSPWSMKWKLKSSPETISFPGVTNAQATKYLSTFPPALKAMVFAYPFDTLINATEHGTWETLPDGSRIWRLSIYSRDAQSINLIFGSFRLPAGAAMYLYTPGYADLRGSFTSENQTATGVLATVPLPGDRITVELDVPANPEFLPVLEIVKVSHDFKGFFSSLLKESYNVDCNVDINCPPGDAWQTEKRAVVKFVRGGIWLCSGSLINNARNDGRPLLLTANHTIGTATHAEQSIFFFRYERPTCDSGNGTLQYSLSGSKLLATTSKLDFSLVELSTVPPQSYDPYFAGWDRRVLPYLDTVTCIHHPNGSLKKISKSYHRVVTGDFGGGYDSNTHWKISAWDLGTTEPGSSGSPLFNADHRIVGDLTGGDASCSYNFNDYFEKFSVSWDKYADSSNQLKYWLDPEQSGVFVVNGYDPYSGGKPVANFSIRPQQIQVGRKVYFTDLSAGMPTSWHWSFENGTPATSDFSEPNAIKFDQPGNYHVSLFVSNEMGSDSAQQTITVSDYPAYSISENRVVPDRRVVLADRSTGTPFITWSVNSALSPVTTDRTYEFSLMNMGDYTVNERVEYPGFIDTLIHYNQIRVLPEVIAYHSYSFNNLAPDEHSGYVKTGSQGYLPGSNNQGVVAFAEEFRNTSDTALIINGITIPVELMSAWARNYYLPIVFWNAKRQVILRDSVLISGFKEQSRFTHWLRSPVNFDTLVYAGFEVRSWDQGTFAAKMATDRGQRGQNTMYVLKGTSWQPMSEFDGTRTSMDLALEISTPSNPFINEIKIIPNFNDGVFTLDLGRLVFNQVNIDVYSITGQKLITAITRTENQISFRISPPVSGVYIVRMIIDKYQFSTKVVILKQ